MVFSNPGSKSARRQRASSLSIAALVLASLLLGQSSAGSSGLAWEAVPGGWVSGPVEYVKTLPIDAGGGVGATRQGKHLYITTFRSFSIYDVSDVLNPQLLSSTPLGPQVFNEQPVTDGKILLLTKDAPAPVLQVWDVADKAAPAKITDVALPKTDHIWTCVFECRYAYGGRGTIVDLRKPAAPKIVGDWAESLSIERFHAIEEVAPGRVMTGSRPIYYLDGRKNPKKPRVVFAQPLVQTGAPGLISPANPPPAWLDWPNNTRDRFALVSTETPFSGQCSENSGAFYTYDTRGWAKHRSFKLADTFRIETPVGNYTEGRSPYNAWGCSAYAFDTPPNYAKSRRVAVAWFENGMRLLGINAKGKLTETGGFIPLGGSTSAPIWLDARTLYLVDINRGIDILQVD